MVSGYSVTSFVYFLLVIIPITLLVVLLFVWIGGDYAESLTPIPNDVQETLLIARLTNNCLRYDNGVDPSYANVLDVKKFTPTVFKNCFGEEANVRIRMSTEFRREEVDRSLPSLSTGVTDGTVYKHYSVIRLEDGSLEPVLLTFVVN